MSNYDYVDKLRDTTGIIYEIHDARIENPSSIREFFVEVGENDWHEIESETPTIFNKKGLSRAKYEEYSDTYNEFLDYVGPKEFIVNWCGSTYKNEDSGLNIFVNTIDDQALYEIDTNVFFFMGDGYEIEIDNFIDSESMTGQSLQRLCEIGGMERDIFTEDFTEEMNTLLEEWWSVSWKLIIRDGLNNFYFFSMDNHNDWSCGNIRLHITEELVYFSSDTVDFKQLGVGGITTDTAFSNIVVNTPYEDAEDYLYPEDFADTANNIFNLVINNAQKLKIVVPFSDTFKIFEYSCFSPDGNSLIFDGGNDDYLYITQDAISFVHSSNEEGGDTSQPVAINEYFQELY